MIRNIIAYCGIYKKKMFPWSNPMVFNSFTKFVNEIKYKKYLKHQTDNCPKCEAMLKKRRKNYRWEE